MSPVVSAAVATLRLRLQEIITYRLDVLDSVLGVLVSCLLFFGIDRLFALLGGAPLDLGDSYLAYVLIGLAVNGLVLAAMFQTAQQATEAEQRGILAWLWMGGCIRPPAYMYCAMLPALAERLLEMLIFAVIAVLLGVSLPDANWLGGLIVLLLSMAAFAGFGLISAASYLWLKRGNPFNIMFGSLAGVLAGVYFPAHVMPEALQWLAKLIPLTYTLHGLRACLLDGAGLAAISGDIMALAGFGLLFWLLGWQSWQAAVRRVRREGSLGFF